MTDKQVMQQALDALVMVRDLGVTNTPLDQDSWDVVYEAIFPLFQLIEHETAIALPVQPAYPDPTPEMLNGDVLFDAIWGAIKGWDISRLNDGMYSGPSGNDARHIYDSIKLAQPLQSTKN